MSGFLKKTLFLGLGLASLTAEKIEEVVDDLIKKGELSEGERAKTIKEFLEKAESSSKELKEKIESTVKEVSSKMQFSSKKEIDELKQKVADLEKIIEELTKKD